MKSEELSLKSITFMIEGMSCASCANTVEKSLSEAKGIEEAVVNITSEKAKINYDPDKISPVDIKNIVENTGYRLKTKYEEVPIEGMSCASCASKVEKNFSKVEGVLEANVNIATEKGRVEYIAGMVTRKDIVQAVEEAGYIVGKTETDSGKEEEQAEEEEMFQARRKIIYAFALTIPVFILMFSGMAGYHLPVSPVIQVLIEAALAFPVVFILGYDTYRGAFQAVKHGGANMDVLISLGSFAAYGYGISSLFFDLDRFFGLAAGIMAFHLLGRYLEARAKGKASQAIKKLLELEPETARILDEGEEKEV